MLKAPQLQTATDTINTLSSRLTSATLLEDKRAAILGLRSFAKGFPASVASSSLRDLIACLRDHGSGLAKDGEGDVDTVRSVLETLQMLFNPDEGSPEASEDIGFWLADEFSQRQDNITILLDFLEVQDYYVRINSLQLLTSIASARPERTQQCILQAPLGTTRLVGVLDDGRDAVRDAGLLLLVDLTSVSQTDLQKLIAFEDAFPRVFRLMVAEGGIAEGGVFIQDCLSLLANLVRHSSSNQTLFRETGCIPRLVDAVKQAGIWDQEENEFSRMNRQKNAWGVLAILRLFLEKGELGTKTNQDAFWKGGMVQLILELAFNALAPVAIRSSALQTCADMITSNPPLQESFAGLPVAIHHDDQAQTNGVKKSKEIRRAYVIEALLAILLGQSTPDLLELRYSASVLIKAYCLGHPRIKHHFLQRAIAGFVDGEDDATNIMSTLMSGPHSGVKPDALRFIFAADILSQLLAEDEESKSLLQAVSEGNAERGEDVVSAIQVLAGHLTLCLQTDFDPRIIIAYLTLLITAFFESQTLINDCLAEGSSLLGALLEMSAKSKDSQINADIHKSLLPGLCAVLLGTMYEFSSKDSPIPRRTLQPLLLERLGRQRYFDSLKQLRQHPYVRDAEFAGQQGATSDQGQILFNAIFIDLFKDEYGRLRRAIDKDPGIEVVSKAIAGVDRDVLDDLRTQLTSREEAIQQLEQGSLMLKQNADQAGADHRRELQALQASQRSMELEVDRIKRINETLQREHEEEVNRLKEDMSHEMERMQISSKSSSEAARQQHEKEVERLKGQHGASLASERSLWEDKIRKASEQGKQDAAKSVGELKDAIQKRDNDLVVTRQDLKTAKADLEKSKDELDAQKRKGTATEDDLKKIKDLQSNLQQVNAKAMARVKSLEEEAKRAESRHNLLNDDRDKVESERAALEAKIKDFEQEADSLKLELKTERKGFADLEQELEKAKQTMSKRESEAQDALKKCEKLSQDLEKAKKAPAATKDVPKKGDDKKVKQLQNELEAAKKQAEEQKEEAKKARGELDDMLMVMSDIEAKRDEYKARLKKAGEQVSEDEDDEGEEEDEGPGSDNDSVE
ncbi:hypothetical protein ANO11243_079930 [Dothideomycetidae sp. 11243]|nr:hypothetical protein ANO11243_079930 [fungal sp. No.11243]